MKSQEHSSDLLEERWRRLNDVVPILFFFCIKQIVMTVFQMFYLRPTLRPKELKKKMSLGGVVLHTFRWSSNRFR